MNLSEEERIRYSKQLSLKGFGEIAQAKLKSASVLVVGAGGLGCPNLLYLAATGVGNIGIIDGDVVSLSNLQRQVIFDIDDIGKNKSERAKDALLRKNPNVKVKSYPYFINVDNCLSILKDYEVIIDACDNFATSYLLNDACVILNKPFVYAALFGFEGQLSVFNYQSGPTLRCLFPKIPKEGLINNCDYSGVLGTLPGVIGTWQAQETIKIICEIGEVLSGKLMVLDFLNNDLSFVNFKATDKNKEIKALGHFTIRTFNHNLEIDAHTLKEWLNIEELQIIDVREDYEFDEMNIGGLNIPLSLLQHQMAKIKNQKTVLICQSGNRSITALQILNKKFPEMEIYSLKGGLKVF